MIKTSTTFPLRLYIPVLGRLFLLGDAPSSVSEAASTVNETRGARTPIGVSRNVLGAVHISNYTNLGPSAILR